MSTSLPRSTWAILDLVYANVGESQACLASVASGYPWFGTPAAAILNLKRLATVLRRQPDAEIDGCWALWNSGILGILEHLRPRLS